MLGSTPVSFPVMRRRKCLVMKRLSQPSSTSPGKRAEKLCEAKVDVKRVTQIQEEFVSFETKKGKEV